MSQSSDRVLSQDVVFDLLSSPRRRFVLYYLRQQDGPVGLGELASELAAWENETAVDDITEQQRKRVYVSLYQTHIPKLEESGIVAYDSESGEVRLLPRVNALGQYLADEEERFPWQSFYFWLAAASLVFYVAVLLGVPVLGEIPQAVAALVIILAFGATAVVQYVVNRRSRWSLPLSRQR